MTRSAQDIGAGLAVARSARPIRAGERIHVLGIAGAGASAAALVAQAAGAILSGCDPGGPSPYSEAVLAAGIPVIWDHDPAHVRAGRTPDRLAVTKALTAIAPDHPELMAARAAGITVESWQQVVADAAVGRRLVAVAGTHGKSTTAGWLVHLLTAAGADPSAFVGALLPPTVTSGAPATARIGHGEPFIVEADEYAGNFDPYRPSVAVLTSAEWDHPDVFADMAAVADVFAGWIQQMPEGATLVANVGDPGVAGLLGRLSREVAVRLVAYGLSDVAPDRGGYLKGISDQYATALGSATPLIGRIIEKDPDGTTVEVTGIDPRGPVTIRLPTAGRHNAANALGVAGAAVALGIQPDAIAAGLASFPGIGRRMEHKGDAAGVAIYDDYAHHPTAIRETIAAVRQRTPGRRLWAVYEPLTFHRTAALLKEFAVALGDADAVVLAPIWAGRDPDTSIASPGLLAAAVTRLRPNLPVAAPGSVDETADWLAGEVADGDVVLVMGGGRSYQIGERLLRLLGAQRT